MSQATPRKFSEKIAIMARKQNEDEDAFAQIMRDVRSITSEDPVPQQQQQQQLQPGQWNRPSSSLPDVHQMSQQQWQQDWEAQQQQRGRHPQHQPHYHPYGKPRSQERVPPLHYHVPYPSPQQHLQPPENWNGFGRARSDPAIHTHMQQPQQQQGGMMMMHPQHMYQQMQPHMQQHMIQSQMMMGGMGGQMQMPPNSIPVHPMPQSPQQMQMYAQGSPMQQSPLTSPLGSPLGMMELSPPMPNGMHNGECEVGSLPNMSMQQQPPPVGIGPGPSYYHQQVGQRHSVGAVQMHQQRLAPSSAGGVCEQSQSAPNSPAQTTDPLKPQWPQQRPFSNSPENIDIPNIVLTGADGTGGQLDCFQDLADLHLSPSDMQMLCNGNNGAPDPLCQPQPL